MMRNPQAATAEPRNVNWLEFTSRSILTQCPEIEGLSDYISERLAALMLERLPPELAREILGLLPANVGGHSWPLQASARCPANTSIGYPDFVERVTHALGSSGLRLKDEGRQQRLAFRIAAAFLWAFSQELSPELKTRMTENLPADLRSRMNLYNAHSEDAKVA